MGEKSGEDSKVHRKVELSLYVGSGKGSRLELSLGSPNPATATFAGGDVSAKSGTALGDNACGWIVTLDAAASPISSKPNFVQPKVARITLTLSTNAAVESAK